MQAIRCAHIASSLRRLALSNARKSARSITSSSTSLNAARTAVPWFVDPEPVPLTYTKHMVPPHLEMSNDAPALPVDAPEVLKTLHAQLLQSPHLDTSELVVSPAVLPPPGPPLSPRAPQGRRKRGGIPNKDSGIDSKVGGIWNWVVIAQVKEGTENRGAIESVVRLIRKTLLKMEPPVPLAPKRRENGSGWVMIDGGSFAIHVVSKSSRQKYFSQADW